MTDRKTRVLRVPKPLIAALAVGMFLVACGDEQQPESADDDAAEATDLDAKPAVASFLPEDRGDPPDEPDYTDVVEGDGQEAVRGSVVSVHYVGVRWVDGVEFDASWDRGQLFTFEIGAGRVIRGWDEGVEGMRVGGRRILVLPPEWAYGEGGAGDLIGPNETLVFVVDLVDVDPASVG